MDSSEKLFEVTNDTVFSIEQYSIEMADRFVILRRYEKREDLLKTQEQVDEEFLNSGLIKSNRHMMTIAGGICCAEDLVEAPEAVMMVNRANFAQKEVKNKPGKRYAFYDRTKCWSWS